MAAKMTVDFTSKPRRKLALVIGISEYEDGQNLPNAANDANDMASALQHLGFDIDEGKAKTNCTRKRFRHELVEFEESIKEGDMIVFYFAGHGRQWEDQNYLIPADNLTEIIKDDVRTKVKMSGPELEDHAINAQDIVARVTKKKPFVTIFFLDCCRTYHLRREELIKRETVITRAEREDETQANGLKPMSGSVGSLIVFACAPGAKASDGAKGEKNSLFAKHLLKHIQTPNEPIVMMLVDVFSGVIGESKSQQIPYFTGTLTSKNICLYEAVSGA